MDVTRSLEIIEAAEELNKIILKYKDKHLKTIKELAESDLNEFLNGFLQDYYPELEGDLEINVKFYDENRLEIVPMTKNKKVEELIKEVLYVADNSKK